MQFVDLNAQYQAYKDEIDTAIAGVIQSSAYIKGPELASLEKELATFTGVKHAIGCSSGTDALLLPLMAFDVQPGDEILLPDFTFIATAEIPAFYRAKPVFVDVNPTTFLMDPDDLEKKITSRSVGIIPVSLYGQIADMGVIQSIADKHGLWVMEDGAQSFGATQGPKKSGAIALVSTTSFFPAKPLGCFGDGGAVFTNDEPLAQKMRVLLNHGQEQRYKHSMVGINGRLDGIQAAILRVKLKYFQDEIDARNRCADIYTSGFKQSDLLETPVILPDNSSTFAQYTLKIKNGRRDELREKLQEKGIPSAVHYPIPLHMQQAFSYLNGSESDCPVSIQASKEVLSLPMHAFLKPMEQERVISTVLEVLND